MWPSGVKGITLDRTIGLELSLVSR